MATATESHNANFEYPVKYDATGKREAESFKVEVPETANREAGRDMFDVALREFSDAAKKERSVWQDMDAAVSKAHNRGLETASKIMVWMSEKKEAAARYFRGEVETKFPTNNEILEVKKNAHHEVHLAISTEIGKRAFAEVFPDGKIDWKQISEHPDQYNLPRSERQHGLSKKEKTIGKPQIYLDTPVGAEEKYDNGQPKEIFMVVRTNNNRFESKSTVMVATVKLNRDGTPQWEGREHDGRGVFSTMTEREYNDSCKGTNSSAKWRRGELDTKSYSEYATGTIIEKGVQKQIKLKEYWAQHDKEFTTIEKAQIKKNFEDAIINVEERKQELVKKRGEELAIEADKYVKKLEAADHVYELNLEQAIAMMSMVVARRKHAIRFSKSAESKMEKNMGAEIAQEALKNLGVLHKIDMRDRSDVMEKITKMAEEGAARLLLDVPFTVVNPNLMPEMTEKMAENLLRYKKVKMTSPVTGRSTMPRIEDREGEPLTIKRDMELEGLARDWRNNKQKIVDGFKQAQADVSKLLEMNEMQI